VGHDLNIEDSRSHSDTPQSVGLLWTSDQLVAEPSTWQHTTLKTNINASDEIRTRSLSKRAAADLRLRPRGHWDRHNILLKVKVKWSSYRPSVAQRVGRGIAVLFHDRGTRRGWVVSSTHRPPLPPGKTRYPLHRRLGVPQGRSGRAENFVPTGIRSRTVQPVAQSLYRLSYRAGIT